MSWKIRYTDDRGKSQEMTHTHNQSNAEGWAKNMAEKYGKATCVEVADGPYDYSGKETHIVTYGDK